MEPGVWIVVLGMLFLFGVIVAALLPDGFWESGKNRSASRNPSSVVGSNAMTQPALDGLQMIPVAAVAPAATNGSGLVMLQQAPTVNFSGTVQQISEQPQSDGQLHLWLTAANGQEQRISVGPGWFLKYLGCPLTHDVTVDGSGFSFERGGTSPLIYAKRIRMNGRICQLRNDEGFALWSNKLR
ncbi:MAG: hypothetical protein HQL91_01965 [Magnetococcales bacterium]|nr:hypothetical protein [Magnetococcales bacterium]